MNFEGSKISPIDTDKVKKYKPNWTEEELSEVIKAVKDQTPIKDLNIAKNRTINAIYKKAWSKGFGSIRRNGVLYLTPDIRHDKHQRKKRRVSETIIQEPAIDGLAAIQKSREPTSHILDIFTDKELHKIASLFQNEVGKRLCR